MAFTCLTEFLQESLAVFLSGPSASIMSDCLKRQGRNRSATLSMFNNSRVAASSRFSHQFEPFLRRQPHIRPICVRFEDMWTIWGHIPEDGRKWFPTARCLCHTKRVCARGKLIYFILFPGERHCP